MADNEAVVVDNGDAHYPAPTENLVYVYQEQENPHGAFIPGVPLRDLTEADLKDLPEYIIKSIEECGLFQSADTPVVEGDKQDLAGQSVAEGEAGSQEPVQPAPVEGAPAPAKPQVIGETPSDLPAELEQPVAEPAEGPFKNSRFNRAK